MPAAYLPDQRFLRVSGQDAKHFLQNLITTDIEAMPAGDVHPGALLTPQGKILFDFLIFRDGDDFLIETSNLQIDALLRRLTLYKLRAAVVITATEDQGVTVHWGEPSHIQGLIDIRFAKAGITLGRHPGKADIGVSEGDYDALRIGAGIAISGRDYDLEDVFPHDVLLDVNGGLSFKKGCYVGQEVVSRMQHRGTARRRLVHIHADQDLPHKGTAITAGGKPVGAIGSVREGSGLAIVRIDRVSDALNTQTPILAGEIPITVNLPQWSGLSFPARDGESTK